MSDRKSAQVVLEKAVRKPERLPTPPRHPPKVVTALRRFAISITILNVLGYTILGFEQPWTWPLIALATGYTMEILLEAIGARVDGRMPRFQGNGMRGFVEFLFPAHITSLAVNMLLFPNDQVLVMMFAITVAVGAKWVLKAPVKGRMRHFMNPSNFGIAAVLLLFPWASIAPPYHFTENIAGAWDWLLPAVIVVSGTMINAKLTGRMWLIAGWLTFFVVQSVVRGWVLDTAVLGALGTMTGVAFVLFTNYMISDPGTSPSSPASQFAFGAGIAVTYGFLTGSGIAYGLFFALVIVCAGRGAFLWALHIADRFRAKAEKAESEKVALEEVAAPPDPANNGSSGAAREPVAVGVPTHAGPR